MDDDPDEFAMFVNASIHPPNELSVPRCYPDPPPSGGDLQPNTLGVKQYVRSKSVSGGCGGGGGGGGGGLLTASSPYGSGSRHPMLTQKSLGSCPGVNLRNFF
jgi:hypothetical protein